MAIDTHTLEQALAAAFADFIAAFTAFDESRINTSPTAEQWTPAQVTTHIILATDGVPDHTTQPTEREADIMLARIRPWWEDLNQKFKAPQQLKPDNAPRTKQQVLAELNRVRSKDLQLITTHNLGELCLDFELPGIGYLTRYEWLWFIEMHLKRHTFQLHNMLKQHNAEF